MWCNEGRSPKVYRMPSKHARVKRADLDARLNDMVLAWSGPHLKSVSKRARSVPKIVKIVVR